MRLFLYFLVLSAALNSACANVNPAADLPKRFANGGFKFVSFTESAKPYQGKLPRIPKGCPKFEVEQPVVAESAIVVKAADFGFNAESEDCAAAINRALAHCRKVGAARLELGEGVYKCFDADGVKLDGMKDFTLDGKGATLIFRRKTHFPKDKSADANFTIKNCLRVKLCNFKCDWDWQTDPLGAFVKVIGNHADKNGESYIDVEFTGYKEYPLYKKPMPIKVMTLMDESCEGISNERGSAYFGTGNGHYGTKNEWLSPNTVRIYPGIAPIGLPRPQDYKREYSQTKNFWISSRALVGRTYRIMHYYYGKNAFSLSDSEHVSFENIDVYSCRGMGFIVFGKAHYWQAVNVSFAPPENALPKRACSTTADAVHCTSNGGFCKLVNFRVTLNQDDIYNFHDKGAFAKIVGPMSLNLLNMGGVGYIGALVGDEVELFNPDYTPTDFKAKIAKISGNVIELSKELPQSKTQNFIVQKTAFCTQNILIKDCVFKNHAGRGIMQSSNVTIENCRFENGISIPMRFQRAFSMRDWAEGYGCKNVVVRNCDFIGAKINQGLYGVYHDVFAGSRRVDDASDFDKSATASNILIEKCRFKNLVGMCFYTFYAQNAIFRNNTIDIGTAYEPKSYAGCALFEHSDNIAFVNNKIFSANPEKIGAFVSDNSDKITVKGNTSQKSKTE